MAVFAYKGRNSRGDLVEGTLDGDDSGVIADQLVNIGVIPIDVTPFRGVRVGSTGKTDRFKNLFQDKQVSPIELMLFSRQMYTLLKAGVPIMRALAACRNPPSIRCFPNCCRTCVKVWIAAASSAPRCAVIPRCFRRSMSAWCRSAK